MDLLFWVVMYVLAGLTYTCWLTYAAWYQVHAQILTSGLTRPVIVGTVVVLVIMDTAMWPRLLYARLRRAWKGRSVPPRLRRITQSFMREAIRHKLEQVRKALAPRDE